MKTIYYAAFGVFAFCAMFAVVHVWIYGTFQWPVTLLTVAIAALWVRQEAYAEMLKQALLGDSESVLMD